MEVGSIKNSVLGSVSSLHAAAPAEAARVLVAEGAVGAVDAQQNPRTDQPPESEAARAQVEDAVSAIQGFVQSVRRNLDFHLDDSSGRVVVKVTDSESGDVIRQIPTEDALKLAESLEEVRSLLFKAEA